MHRIASFWRDWKKSFFKITNLFITHYLAATTTRVFQNSGKNEKKISCISSSLFAASAGQCVSEDLAPNGRMI